MNSLLKLQPQVVLDTADEQGAESPKRPLSIPASRLANAQKDAETHTSNASRMNGSRATDLFVPSRVGRRDVATKATQCAVQPSVTTLSVSETRLTRSTPSFPVAAASSAVEKAALVEESNSKGCLACPGGAVLPALMTKLSDVERLLYTLLPPKRSVCKETGRTIMQFVSLEPPLRTEVAELHERLIQQLHQRRARNSGICPIRREVYAEVFDELIRQTTLEEPARGVLLLRVRDELYQTLAAHCSLLERAMHSASKRRADATEGLDVLKRHIKELEEKRSKLLVRRKTAEMRVEQLQVAIEQENVARARAWQEELGYYRRVSRQLTQRIKAEAERANAHGTNLNVITLEDEGVEAVTQVTT